MWRRTAARLRNRPRPDSWPVSVHLAHTKRVARHPSPGAAGPVVSTLAQLAMIATVISKSVETDHVIRGIPQALQNRLVGRLLIDCYPLQRKKRVESNRPKIGHPAAKMPTNQKITDFVTIFHVLSDLICRKGWKCWKCFYRCLFSPQGCAEGVQEPVFKHEEDVSWDCSSHIAALKRQELECFEKEILYFIRHLNLSWYVH